jgi:hypothetical protein
VTQEDRLFVRTWEIHRVGLRWAVLKRTSFPNGAAGVYVRDYLHRERMFWRFSTAREYVAERPTFSDVEVHWW